MSRTVALGLVFGLVAVGVAGAQPASQPWVEMSTGATSRVFVDTASVVGQGDNRTVDVIIIDSLQRKRAPLELHCVNRQYRFGSGGWQNDDPANVRRMCDRNFGGLKTRSRAEVDAVALFPRVLGGAAVANQWILVDWSKDQMVLVNPTSITRDAKGWRFETIYQVAGRGGPARHKLLADCDNRNVVNDQAVKSDDLLGSMFGEIMRLSGQGPGSLVHAVLYLTFCPSTMQIVSSAPTVDLTAALAARAGFEAARSNYLRQHPGADLANVIAQAPGPKELGGYQLSLMDLTMPFGLRSEVVGAEKGRVVVQQTFKHPFSAVGRLFIKDPKGWGHCSATLIGNSRTVLTARHCGIGTEYVFALGNAGRDQGIPARIVATGDYPIRDGRDGLGIGSYSEPKPNWDDWMVLDLERPSVGEPLAVPSAQYLQQVIQSFDKPYFHIAGFPADVKSGDRMIYSRGCGVAISKASYKQAHTSQTGCASYKGSSGSALLVLSQHRYIPIGILSGGNEADTSFSILVVGSRAFDAIRAKVLGECRSNQPGLRAHPLACPATKTALRRGAN